MNQKQIKLAKEYIDGLNDQIVSAFQDSRMEQYNELKSMKQGAKYMLEIFTNTSS